jgi:hypothetical protein
MLIAVNSCRPNSVTSVNKLCRYFIVNFVLGCCLNDYCIEFTVNQGDNGPKIFKIIYLHKSLKLFSLVGSEFTFCVRYRSVRRRCISLCPCL